MNTRVTIDVESATPPYDQIRSQIASLIAVGSLTPGMRLPTVRNLASDLGVAPGTVGRAYKELETAGLIESRRRNGTVVSAHGAARSGNPDASAEVSAAVVHLIQTARRAGMDNDTLLRLVEAHSASTSH
ncbi:DNA-binding transcriptional regulator YhcF (GntR family) [Arthrobacter pigmenti]|uniref:DNA-binding transcriptional regulator YhcF (GntR family) n=1 Tax=Arthrobacter pigmenti TaxID=271432 RepID=A0A846RW00_9MICC|nr:GntR family transcriptional regulator [Arthrobacter pigmenti]NJC23206.1 DNA-binding transcriptional regulator YhcF (GntR family) [Arthrobacter pigmenti]